MNDDQPDPMAYLQINKTTCSPDHCDHIDMEARFDDDNNRTGHCPDCGLVTELERLD